MPKKQPFFQASETASTELAQHIQLINDARLYEAEGFRSLYVLSAVVAALTMRTLWGLIVQILFMIPAFWCVIAMKREVDVSHSVMNEEKMHPHSVRLEKYRNRVSIIEKCAVFVAIEVDRLQELSKKSELKVEADLARSHLLQAVAHDLRTPLAAVIGTATSLMESDQEFSKDQIKKFGKEIYTESEQLNRLINNLLQITYLEAKDMQLEKKLCSIHDIITTVIQNSKNKEITFIVKTETIKDFFDRGKYIASQLDKNKTIPSQKIISFEDPNDLIQFLSEAKLALLTAIRKKPNSISKLAHQLHRSRSSVDKDVRLLESLGIVLSEYVTNPGHGKRRIIKAIDKNPIKLRVETLI